MQRRKRWLSRIDAGLRLWCQAQRTNSMLLRLVIEHFSHGPPRRIRLPNLARSLAALHPPG
jgi:hypothetical protein